jgi:hypothetical protein
MKNYSLTKTKIKSGLQCHKKMWFDFNEPLIEDNFAFHLGNRFGDHIKSYYGSGIDLTGLGGSNIEQITLDAISDQNVNVIYEGAFIFSDTHVRADVLIRDNDKWKLIEVKSSSSLQDEHIKDAAIQAYVIKNSNISLSEIKIAHINKEFSYLGDGNYQWLITEVMICAQVNKLVSEVPLWIKELLPISLPNAEKPDVEMGAHCKNPFKCQFIKRCKSQTYIANIEVPINILPFVGESLQKKWFKSGIYDLRDLPNHVLKNEQYKQIQLCHQENKEWISPALIDQIKNYDWPRYFMDFETVQHGVPIIKDTSPREAVPFQWSVHKWDNINQELTLEDGDEFLKFSEENLERNFLESLIKKSDLNQSFLSSREEFNLA